MSCNGEEIRKPVPKMSQRLLNIYYEEESGLRLGAVCSVCDLRGYFSDDRLAVMTAI